MRIKLLCAVAGVILSMATSAATDQGGTGRVGTPPPPPPTSTPSPGGDCVNVKTPQPTRIFTIRHQDPGGSTTRTEQWESVTATGSRVKTTGPDGVIVQVNTHSIIGGVAVLKLSMKTNANGGLISSTEFSPGLISDPVGTVCAKKSWSMASVAVSYRSASGQGGSAMSPSGTLTILGIREKVTVPAGTFDTVHYLRATSQANDEYWKSIEHGVIVKHLATSRGGSVSEQLISIK